MTPDLKTLVERYLNEKVRSRSMSIGEAAHAYMELIGPSGTLGRYGLVQFLGARGIKRPTARHLNHANVTEFRTVLESNFGYLRARAALEAIRPFWA